MASEVDICNLALANLGDTASIMAINPPDGSVQAARCARFYPIARDALLSMPVLWSFATRREVLQAVDVDPLPDQWGFAYALPNKCLLARRVLLPGAADDAEGEEYLIETTSAGDTVLYTNAEDATLIYTAAVTDTTKFPPLVVNAMARLLESYLAGPTLKGKEGRAAAKDIYKVFLNVDYPLAAGADANASKRKLYNDFTPSSIAARR